MENAADALKIAFAVFVFVIAITITFSLISQAKSTADYVFYYGDKTNFQEPLETKGTNRTVGVKDIISTLYRYYNESVAVTIVIDGNQKTFDQALNEGKTPEIVENELAEYINGTLLSYSDRNFEEEFTEVPTSGIYDEGGDGTEIVISSGGKKVYIIYKMKPLSPT